MSASPLVLLDACVVVNLFASRRIAEIVDLIEGTAAIVETVNRESQYVLRGGDGDDAKEREPVDLLPLTSAGVITILTSDDESELMTFIDLSRELDDGEAMTAALAIHRGGIVVTDDQKASRLLRDRGIALLSTLDLCKHWAEYAAESPESVRTLLLAIRERGRYEPSRSHPLRHWRTAMLGEA
jgi:predicted nucleic acid-binding protein